MDCFRSVSSNLFVLKGVDRKRVGRVGTAPSVCWLRVSFHRDGDGGSDAGSSIDSCGSCERFPLASVRNAFARIF